MNEYVIQTDGLEKKYGDVTALSDLHLQVPQNSIFGFLGPNGAGKTTTMKLLLGLIRPSSGSGSIMGHDIVSASIAVRSRIGYLPQQPSFYDEMTAREILKFTIGFFFSGSSAEIDKRIDETISLVGLKTIADRPVQGYSGGERQRLGIAQAYINHPDVLILDEPAAALDPVGRRDVLEIMERLREHATIFYSTHILDDVQQVSDTVAILNKGRLVTQGSIDGLLAGDGGTTYDVRLKGEANALKSRLESLDWINLIEEERDGETLRWTIPVLDDLTAEERLFRLLAQEDTITVLQYGKRTYELEEVFMQLVGDGNSGEGE